MFWKERAKSDTKAKRKEETQERKGGEKKRIPRKTRRGGLISLNNDDVCAVVTRVELHGS